MINFSKSISLLFFLISTSVFSQNTTSTFLKTSTSIESNLTFVSSKTIEVPNSELFKNQNFNTFYLIKTIESNATKTFYSFDIASNKDGNYVIKTIYDSDKSIISIHISSYDTNKLKAKILSTSDLANRIKGCNRYDYSLGGCWQAFLDWIG